MNLLCWQGEEKLPQNCSCVNLTITFFNRSEKQISAKGKIVITHYYANEWVRAWSADHFFVHNKWNIRCENNGIGYSFVSENTVDLAIADLIAQEMKTYSSSKQGMKIQISGF